MKLEYLTLLLLVLASACIKPETRMVRDVGGPYNAKIIEEKVKSLEGNELWVQKVQYTYKGREERAFLALGIDNCLEWYRNNTKPGDKVVSWWDYGKSIRGYTGSEVVTEAPSESILEYVAGGWSGPLSSDESIQDVAEALTTTNPNRTIELMEKYKANYILVHGTEMVNTLVLLKAAGVSPNEYVIYNTEGDFRLSPKGLKTTFARMLKQDVIPGFEQIAANQYCVLFGLKGTT